MMNSSTIIIIAILQVSIPLCSTAQFKSYYSPVSHEKDSALDTEFHDYLDFLIAQPNDSVQELDSNKVYEVVYITTNPFDFIGMTHDSSYLDSNRLICTENVQKSTDSASLGFLDHNNLHSEKLILNDSFRLKLHYNLYRNQIISGLVDADYTLIISFSEEKYLILSERRFGPDIRGSNPPGYDVTWFLELIE